jgi:hypothetical protein
VIAPRRPSQRFLADDRATSTTVMFFPNTT